MATKDISNLKDLFMHQLQMIFYAEQQLQKMIPHMTKKISDASLKSAAEHHLKETQSQIKRLEQVFEAMGKKPEAATCPTMDGLIKEGEDVLSTVTDEHLCDAAVIAAMQAVEHHEITTYGTMIAWARQLGRKEVVKLLEETLQEEKSMDKKLTDMAISKINRMAA